MYLICTRLISFQTPYTNSMETVQAQCSDSEDEFPEDRPLNQLELIINETIRLRLKWNGTSTFSRGVLEHVFHAD